MRIAGNRALAPLKPLLAQRDASLRGDGFAGPFHVQVAAVRDELALDAVELAVGDDALSPVFLDETERSHAAMLAGRPRCGAPILLNRLSNMLALPRRGRRVRANAGLMRALAVGLARACRASGKWFRDPWLMERTMDRWTGSHNGLASAPVVVRDRSLRPAKALAIGEGNRALAWSRSLCSRRRH